MVSLPDYGAVCSTGPRLAHRPLQGPNFSRGARARIVRPGPGPIPSRGAD